MPSLQKVGTLADIARLTGLSKASVNAALSGHGGNTRVSAETVRRVQEAAQQLNYRSNSGARALRSNRFNNIGFILVTKESHDYSYSDIILDGLTSAATEAGQNIFLIRVPTMLDFSLKLPRTLREACLDGLIIQDAASLTPEFVEIVESCGVPVVYLNEKRKTNAVYVDDVSTARMMTEFLIKKGFRHIAYFSPIVRVPHYSTADRIEGYRNAMETAGLASEVRRIPSGMRETEYAQWLSSGKLPEAIFCSSDEDAAILLRVLYALDIKVPRDIAIAGINDEFLAAHSVVPLTTMKIPFSSMARYSVDMLMRLIPENSPKFETSMVLMPELVERDSTVRPKQRRTRSHSSKSDS
ncbi:MAG: LacI family DNA-binding transcriptional regulator [Chthoniobacteraceae bacterium]